MLSLLVTTIWNSFLPCFKLCIPSPVAVAFTLSSTPLIVILSTDDGTVTVYDNFSLSKSGERVPLLTVNSFNLLLYSSSVWTITFIL